MMDRRSIDTTSIPGILIGLLFSVFPDFDHIPHLQKALSSGRFGVESRSPIHELIGLVLLLSGSLAAKIAYPHLFPLALTCGLSHFLVDLLTRPSRPLYPFSNKKVDLNLYPTDLRQMFIWDAIVTAALGLICTIILIF